MSEVSSIKKIYKNKGLQYIRTNRGEQHKTTKVCTIKNKGELYIKNTEVKNI